MIRSRSIIFAWLLLLVPTLLLGLGAFTLLQKEEARLAESGRASAADRVSAIAGNIDLAVAEVQDGLLETLRAIPEDDLDRQLESWKRSNPLVRNIFVWQQGRGLTFPDPEQPASEEEAAFVRRYLPLFADQADWELDMQEDEAPPPQANAIIQERLELRQLAKQAPAPASRSAENASEAYRSGAPAAPVAAESMADSTFSRSGKVGWRSWYADNQLHLLGWFSPDGRRLRYGVEIEMMALVSRLLANLPAKPAAGESFALLDGGGQMVHMTGEIEIDPANRPLSSIPLSSLPHWSVVAYADGQATAGSGGIMLIGSLLIGIFIMAILLGGSLLLWQAWRHQREARQKTSFVSNVSHELKTPLTTIRMYGEMLGEGRLNDPDKSQRYLQTIIRESQRLTRLVNNVLDFSRLEQGRKEYAWVPLDVCEKLHELFDTQAVRMEEAGLEVEMIFPDEPIRIDTDRDAFEQVVLNLIDNTVKYAADGKNLSVAAESVSGSLKLEFCDRGPGIPPSHQALIFEKFHRVDTSLTARQQGSGLGLSISRQLARGLGGDLHYQDRIDGGACFTLTLPLRRSV